MKMVVGVALQIYNSIKNAFDVALQVCRGTKMDLVTLCKFAEVKIMHLTAFCKFTLPVAER